MKRFWILIFIIPSLLYAVDKVQIVPNGTSDLVVIDNQKIEVSTGSFAQVIASGTLLFGDGTIQATAFTGSNQSSWAGSKATGTIDLSNFSIINVSTIENAGNIMELQVGRGTYTVTGSSLTIPFGLESTSFTIRNTTSALFRNIFVSSFTPSFLQNFVIYAGTVTLGVGESILIAPVNVGQIMFPMVSESRADAEANQVHITQINTTDFTVKNQSAINSKDVVWWTFAR